MLEHRNQLAILQYNTRKSRVTMIELFGHALTSDMDIIAIQEPWRNPSMTSYHPLKDRFDLIYPHHEQNRVCFYVNKKLTPGSWYPKYHSPDLCSLIMRVRNNRVVTIHNIYNPGYPETGGLDQMRKALDESHDTEQIMLGDFNLHHPSWGGIRAKIDDKAEDLILMAEEFAMEQALPVGTAIYEENCQTTIDLVFATPSITAGIVICDVERDLDCSSDHLPIVTRLMLNTVDSPPTTRRNFNKVDMKILPRRERSKRTLMNSSGES